MTQSINIYDQQLSDDEIKHGLHRDMVGGMWEELGTLQLDFLKDEGLLPTDAFLDVGCGSLRGGLRFVEYLHAGNYCGIDINHSLVLAGKHELEQAGLSEKQPHLLVDDNFAFDRFGTKFDFAIAQSVFSHLPKGHIVNCLLGISRVLKPQGEFFATFFEAPSPAYSEPLLHEPGGVVSYFDRDPFHYSADEFDEIAHQAGLSMRYIGNWGHPRDQRMLGFRLR
ncbi:MAG: class I SAM-dependent methyltransferase [Gammaproteobacteria bacterium]|nr:class I SAM-dependent methyltransferase [Gammaproteobacteria bacterium]MBU1623996.1 class I SAM-dependent methyltransferase [Gammaproteobacteria bacterium]MBU1981724.1 class I SAM-dependent methyltransferase [Gammaproteobacteria bacterium]